MAAVYDFLPADESRRRAAAIAALTLDGKELDSRVANALSDIEYDRTIEGASTVTLKVIDPDGSLLDSGLFSAAVDIELPAPAALVPKGKDLPLATDDPLGYRLTQIKTAGALLILAFENREIASMRAHKGLRKASRSDVTRAEFIRSLVREVKTPQRIRFWSPELHERQPVGDRRDLDTRPVKEERRQSGFGAYTPEVKGVEADRSQIRLLEQALDTALSMRANERVLVGLVAAMTQESVVANMQGKWTGPGRPAGEPGGGGGGGYLIDVGVLHQNSLYWPATRNVPKDVKPFIQRLIAVEKANRRKSIGWCVDAVQRSYTVGTGQQGKDYDQWEAEARETVAAYTGNAELTQGSTVTTEYRKRYWFRRGEPYGERENTWEASGRLAADVNFRRFIDYGVFHYVSDDYLRKAAARMIIERQELPAGVLSVDVGDFDVGKPRRNAKGQNVGGAEIRVEVLTDVLAPPLGGVWIVRGYGPCDGRYLITNVRGSYLKPRATVTLSLPVPKLAEPAADIGTKATTQDSEVRRSVSGGNIEDAYNEAWKIHKRRYPYVWGGGHRRAGTPDTGSPGTAHDEFTDRERIGYDCSGATAAVLAAGGMLPEGWLENVPPSGTFQTSYGKPGKGRYLTVWANGTHVYIEFHGVSKAGKTEHFGTGRWGKDWSGAGFNPRLHPPAGFTARHWSTSRPAGEQDAATGGNPGR